MHGSQLCQRLHGGPRGKHVGNFTRETHRLAEVHQYPFYYLALWPTRAKTFITHVNNFHHTIKFTSEISPTQILFLDVMVSLKDGKFQTDTFSKETDTLYYLHWGFYHPHITKQSTPFSVAFRLIRSSKLQVKNLTSHLKRRRQPH